MDGILVVSVAAVSGIAIICWAMVVATGTVARERTKREIMAYVAEGTVTPEDAVRLIELSEQAELRKKILSKADWDSDSDSYRKTLEKVFELGTKPLQSEKKPSAS